MRNQFGGDCYRCGLWVAPGTGYFEKNRGARGFRVQHCYRKHNGGVTCEMAKTSKAEGDSPIPPSEASTTPSPPLEGGGE